MRANISPGVYEVLGAQCWIGAQKFLLANPQAARLFQSPDWNAGANDARFTAANSWGGIDSGERIVEVLHDEAQQVRLFSSAKAWEQFLDLAQITHARFQFT